MSDKVISVTFAVDAQLHRDGQFTVPARICNILNIKSGDPVIIEIKNQRIKTNLTSGTEIYLSQEYGQLVKSGERIQVTISAA